MPENTLLETTKSEPVVLTIEQLNLQIKQLLEGQTGTLWVQGEISNFKAHTSGHFYFSLKDQRSQISAVMFRGHNSKLKFKPKDGLEVIVRGRISVYEPRGSYQILCEMMEPVGAGALQRAFEDLKEKLRKEGLFETARKKPIPASPRHIAIVTSPTGAAIRDILNIMSRRAPNVQITIVPTIVQGEAAAPQIRDAFLKAQKISDIDVIIIGRGGGSIEDMWCFNDEALARLIAASRVPVISAVGHEIDFTIADFVADLRAPTPSAAAELVAKSAAEMKTKVDHYFRVMQISLERQLKSLLQKIEGLQKRLVDPKKKLQDLIIKNDDLLTRLQLATERNILNDQHRLRLLEERMGTPQELLQRKAQQVDMCLIKMNSAAQRIVERSKSQWQNLTGKLDSLSPLKVVERGYSIVTKDNKLIKSSEQVAAKDMLQIQFAEGKISVRVEGKV